MERITNISHKGKSIILIDLSNSLPEETLRTIESGKAVISRSAPKSALVVTDVTGAKYNKEVAEAIKGFTSFNTPFLKGSAVVGAEGVASVLLQTVIFITRRELKSFPGRVEAFDWLASLP